MVCGGAGAGGRRLELHVRVVPIFILIGLLHWALIILTNCTYDIPVMLSTYYTLVHLFTDGPTQFVGVLLPSGTVGAVPELRT